MFQHFQPKRSFQYSAIFIALLHSSIVYAEDADIHTLPVITVQATHNEQDALTTSASIYKVEHTSNIDKLNVNVSEVLQGVPGLQVNNRENYAQDLQISSRGFGARSTFGLRGIRLYVDGIPATMPDGQGQTSNIDLNSLDHIEVLTGPFSSLYGNSSGGTILAQTKAGEGKDSVRVGFNAGSQQKQHTNITLQGGSDHSSQPAYVISSSYFSTDGYRENSAADKVQSNAKLTWQLQDDSEINWVMNRVSIDADDPAGLTRSDWQTNPKQQAAFLKQFKVRKEIDQIQTGVTWKKPLNEQNELYAMTYFGQRQVVQYQSIPTNTQNNPRHAGGVIDFDRNYYGADLRWTGKAYIPNLTLIAGIAMDRMDEDRQGYENFNAAGQYGVKGDLRRDENNTLWNLDPYLQASWQFLPTWRLDTGLRYSNVHYQSEDFYIQAGNGDDSGKVDYQKLLPSVALGWEIRPELYAYASYGKGFETPTFTEMAYPTLASSGINLSLKPASSDTYELGLKTQNNLGRFTVAVFQTETQNDIVSADSNNGRNTFRNAEQTLRQGAELSWQYDIWRDLDVRASYSYIDATFDADVPASATQAVIAKGTVIPGIANNQAFLSVGWRPEQGIQAGVDMRYMDRIFVDDKNSDSAPSYNVVAAQVGYVWLNRDWHIQSFARVDNLFDRNYVGSVIVNDGNQRFFEPAEGRNWSAGLSVTKRF